MKNKIREISESVWSFIQAVLALFCFAFILFLIALFAISAIGGALWCFDKLFLGGVIFG